MNRYGFYRYTDRQVLKTRLASHRPPSDLSSRAPPANQALVETRARASTEHILPPADVHAFCASPLLVLRVLVLLVNERFRLLG